MKSAFSRVDSFTAADLPALPPPMPSAPAEPGSRAKAVRSGKALKHIVVLKALASPVRLLALEMALNGSALNATDLTGAMRLSARRVSDHLMILVKAGILSKRVGFDKRVTEYVIQPSLVRSAENGTAIFDFGSGQLSFPNVKLPVPQLPDPQ